MGLRTHVPGTNARVVAAIEQTVGAVTLRIIETNPHLAMRAHGRRLTGEQTSRPGAVMRLQTQRLVCVSRGQLLKAMGKLPALDHPAFAIGRYPKAKARHEQLAHIARSFTQLMGSRIGLARRIGDETLGREK
jgi:hypothetical protein